MNEHVCFCGEEMFYMARIPGRKPIYECINGECLFCGNPILETDIDEFDRLVASVKFTNYEANNGN